MRTTGLLLAAIVLAVCALSAHAADGAGSTVGFEVDVFGKWGNSQDPKRKVISLPENEATVDLVMDKARDRNLNENKATRLSVVIQEGQEEVIGWNYPLTEEERLGSFEFRDLGDAGVTGLYDDKGDQLRRFDTPPVLEVRYAGGSESGELRIKRTDREELSDGAIRVRLEVEWTATPTAGTTPTYFWKSKERESQTGQQVEFTFKEATESRCQVNVTAVEDSVLLAQSEWTPVCGKRKPSRPGDTRTPPNDKPIQEPKESSSTGSAGAESGRREERAPEPALDRPKPPSQANGIPVSGLLIDPMPGAAAAGLSDGGPQGSSPAEEDRFALSGEVATLLGVWLLIALGGLIEARVLVRRP